ncbi:MAG: hypothetical protein K0Q77_2067 [Anaerosporomusa subterranea]|jgi:hypothetical protein|nr:hypothetical protein [Anaerosporomusa subterranea]
MKEDMILVPPKIMSSMTEIWDMKQIDPGQYQAVLAEAERREAFDTVQWLRNNQKLYLQGAQIGFAPDHE